jgi:hypothetical protein
VDDRETVLARLKAAQADLERGWALTGRETKFRTWDELAEFIGEEPFRVIEPTPEEQVEAAGSSSLDEMLASLNVVPFSTVLTAAQRSLIGNIFFAGAPRRGTEAPDQS